MPTLLIVLILISTTTYATDQQQLKLADEFFDNHAIDIAAWKIFKANKEMIQKSHETIQTINALILSGKKTRSILATKLIVNNRKFVLINIHSLAANSIDVFLRQLEEIGKYIEKYNVAVLFVGDLRSMDRFRFEKLVRFLAVHYLEKLPLLTEKNLNHIIAQDLDFIEFSHEYFEGSQYPTLYLKFKFDLD